MTSGHYSSLTSLPLASVKGGCPVSLCSATGGWVCNLLISFRYKNHQLWDVGQHFNWHKPRGVFFVFEKMFQNTDTSLITGSISLEKNNSPTWETASKNCRQLNLLESAQVVLWQTLFMYVTLFIYLLVLFLAALGLHCCARAFSSCGERGLLFVAVRGLLIVVASLVAEHRL